MMTFLSKKYHSKLRCMEQAPAYDVSCVPRCSASRAQSKWAKKLLYAPHFQVGGVNFDKNLIQSELSSLEPGRWAGYNNDVLGVRGAGISDYWSALFFRNFSRDADFGFGETKDFLKLLGKEDQIRSGRCEPTSLVKTDLWDDLPETGKLVEQVVTPSLCDRVLITRVAPYQRVNWHSHCEYEQHYTHAYIHIPLVSHKDVEMLVYMDHKINKQHYGEGEAWIINTQHNHAVNNPTSTTRYHLLILGSFEDPKLIQALAKAEGA